MPDSTHSSAPGPCVACQARRPKVSSALRLGGATHMSVVMVLWVVAPVQVCRAITKATDAASVE